MPDGPVAGVAGAAGVRAADGAEAAAVEADAALVRGVGRRLVAWAAGTTLVILVVLAVALYLSVAGTLEASGVRQLDQRVDAIVEFVDRPGPGPRPRPGQDDLPTGFIFGGGNSGTFAIVLSAGGEVVTPRAAELVAGMPNEASYAAATAAGRDVRLASVAGAPVRVMTRPLEVAGSTYYVQVFQDRTAEQRTLDGLLAVLLVGGVVVLLAAAGFGALYSRRALEPIRSSLAAQRRALRRQREFAADASHELRTPLTVIRASVEHLRRHRDEPVATVGDALDDIGAEVDHLARLVDELLLLARSDSGAVTLERLPVDLGDVAADAASSLAVAARQRDVTVDVDPAPTVVVGDAARLRQLVLILVDNAVQHSPQGGRVRVAVRGTPGATELTVEDEGPGIREADLPRLFERFWRGAGAPAGGSGLGLAIAAWIVEGHGGTIVAANRTEGGARFTVRLPSGSA